MKKYRWIEDVLVFRQSIGIIIILVLTILSVATVYKSKIEEIIIVELKQQIISNSYGEVKAFNNSMNGVFEVLKVVSNSISNQQFIGGVSSLSSIQGAKNVTGFSHIGLVDLNGNTMHGFGINEEEFNLIKPVFHGKEMLIAYSEKNASDKHIIFAVPVMSGNFVKYAIFVKVTNKELVKFFKKGRSNIIMDNFNISFLLFNADTVVEINETTKNRRFPDIVLEKIQNDERFQDAVEFLEHVESSPYYLYSVQMPSGMGYYISLMPTSFRKLIYAYSVPSDLVNSKANYIMQMLSILIVAIIAVLTALLFYYEYMMQRHKNSIHDLAYVDELTGLNNKSAMRLKLDKIGRGLENEELYIVTIKLSNLEMIERLYGIEAAGFYMKDLATKLRQNMHEFVEIGFANETFIVYMKRKSIHDCISFFEVFCCLNDIVDIYDYRPVFGCAIYTTNGKELAECDYNLDLCLKNCMLADDMSKVDRSKHSVVVFNKSMRDEMLRCDRLEKELDAALENDEFLVYLQPKYDMRTNKIYGAEALVRWNYKKQGIMPPFKFIPVFERNGSIAKVDNFVLSTVLKMLKSWIDKGLRLIPISVNLSRVQFLNPNLVSDMEEKILSYKGVVNYVDIEITESAMVDEQNSIIDIMKKLKGLGFKMSMDDFGTGYSSLSNISLLPFDTLKIDKSFVDKVDPNNVDSPSVYLISDVISIAKHFNMHSLVEGVENKEQRDLLKNLGCEYCQGYYYAKQMPIEEFEELLAKDEVFSDK